MSYNNQEEGLFHEALMARLRGLGVPVQGNIYYVDKVSGLDTYDGLSPDRAFQSLTSAETAATAGQNDVVVQFSSGTTTANTSQYLSATLTWDKAKTHLIGVSTGGVAGRARIAQLSTATAINPLIDWQAEGCVVAGIHVFQGVDDATSKNAFKLQGDRNRFVDCHIAGIGHNTMDVTSTSSLWIYGGSENTFENCVIGLDTIARGTSSNCEIWMEYDTTNSVACTRNRFIDCEIITYAEAAGHVFVRADGSGDLDRFTIFKRCIFHNADKSAATTMSEALDVHATVGGRIVLEDCGLFGATDWEAATVSGNVWAAGAGAVGNTVGLGYAVAAS